MKETVIGIVTFLVFYYFNFIILAGISSVLVPGGDAFISLMSIRFTVGLRLLRPL